MDEVWQRVDEEEEGLIVLAEVQQSGRGRFQRPWIVPAGTSVQISLLARPPLSALGQLPMLLALAAAEAIEQTTGLTIAIKWPNDLLIGGRKTAGVLVESRIEGEQATVVGGLGINVNFDPAQIDGIPATATSLMVETGSLVDRRRLLEALLEQIDHHYDQLLSGISPLMLWRARIETISRQVAVKAGARTLRGTATGVDREGRLIIRTDAGVIEALAAGEVTLQE